MLRPLSGAQARSAGVLARRDPSDEDGQPYARLGALHVDTEADEMGDDVMDGDTGGRRLGRSVPRSGWSQ